MLCGCLVALVKILNSMMKGIKNKVDPSEHERNVQNNNLGL
jgi:hypothetical protein